MLENIFRYVSLLSIRGGALVLKFLLTVFIARFIGLETLGQYGLVVGLTLFFPSLLRFGVLQNVSREFVGHDKLTLSSHLVSYFICTSLIYLIAVPIGFFIFEFVNSNQLFKFHYLWLPAVIFLEHLISDAISILNTLGQTLKANITSLIQAVLNVVPIFIYYTFSHADLNAEDLLRFWTLGNLLCIVFVFVIWARQHIKLNQTTVSMSWYLGNLKKSSYLYINEFVSVFYAISDRYLIAYFMSIQFVGIYTFYLQLINAVFTLINSSVIQGHKSLILKGIHAKNIASVKNTFKKMTIESVLLMFGMSSVIALLIPFISHLIAKPELLEFINIFWLLIFIFLIRVFYTVIAIVLYAFKRDRFLLKNTVLCISVNLFLVFFISKYSDLYAVPLALLLSFLIGLISCLYLYKKVVENA